MRHDCKKKSEQEQLHWLNSKKVSRMNWYDTNISLYIVNNDTIFVYLDRANVLR